jgi:hypothetical protein
MRNEALSGALGQLTTGIWTRIIWASLIVAEAVDLAARTLHAGRLRTGQSGQALVEWSLAAAVLAFVGIAAWQLAGTAITDSINRTITSLNKAGS